MNVARDKAMNRKSQVLQTLIVTAVVAIGVGARCDENGEDPVVGPILERLGYKLERAKTNIGLGRITNVIAEKIPAEAVGQ